MPSRMLTMAWSVHATRPSRRLQEVVVVLHGLERLHAVARAELRERVGHRIELVERDQLVREFQALDLALAAAAEHVPGQLVGRRQRRAVDLQQPRQRVPLQLLVGGHRRRADVDDEAVVVARVADRGGQQRVLPQVFLEVLVEQRVQRAGTRPARAPRPPAQTRGWPALQRRAAGTRRSAGLGRAWAWAWAWGHPQSGEGMASGRGPASHGKCRSFASSAGVGHPIRDLHGCPIRPIRGIVASRPPGREEHVPDQDSRPRRPGRRHGGRAAVGGGFPRGSPRPGVPEFRLGADRRAGGRVLPHRRPADPPARTDPRAGRADHPGPDAAAPGRRLRRTAPGTATS